MGYFQKKSHDRRNLEQNHWLDSLGNTQLKY